MPASWSLIHHVEVKVIIQHKSLALKLSVKGVEVLKLIEIFKDVEVVIVTESNIYNSCCTIQIISKCFQNIWINESSKMS